MTRGWTEERRQMHRELIYKTKPWEYDTRPKTAWGKECSRWNGYKSMKRDLTMNEQHAIAVNAATGLLEALRITVDQGKKLTKQHLQDFRLAIRILYKFSNSSRDISKYGEICKALATCEVAEDTPQGECDSENSDLAIASNVLRTVAIQYSSTNKILLASESEEAQQMKECLSLLNQPL
jgi:hypothetical protein